MTPYITAISLWEPWATLMAVGAKTVETRHWSTRFRGPLPDVDLMTAIAAELDAFFPNEPKLMPGAKGSVH